MQCFAVLNGEMCICLQLDYGFSKHILLNEFVRGLFSFNLKSVQIPKFLKTNKQTKITHEFIDSVSGVDVKPSSVPVSFVLTGYFVNSSIFVLVRVYCIVISKK